MTGVINVNKSAGVSSAGVVGRVKRLLPRGVKLGHAGTLDPFATGVLVLLAGKATRLAERFMAEPKQYVAMIKLGATTPTLDPESAEAPTPSAGPVPLARVAETLRRFVGEIQQVPPAYSALKIGGQPAYRLARRGGEVVMKPRPVVIYGIELLGYDWPMVEIRVDCGRGMYVRSLARDVGEALGVGGYLTGLCRTRVGPFRIEEAVTVEQLQNEGVARHLRAIET